MLVNAHDHLSHYKEHTAEALQMIEDLQIITLANGMTREEYPFIQTLADECPYVKKGFGIHPWSVTEELSLEGLEPYLADADFYGEIGLDYYWDKRTALYGKQREVLRFFLDQAERYQKLVNLHTKGAEKDVLASLSAHDLPAIIIHWYSGPLDLVEDYLDLGAYFTISVDSDQSSLTTELIRRLPLDRLLTETDGPDSAEWLGKGFGWPDQLFTILENIAQVKQLTPRQVEEQVYANYQRLGL